MDEDYKDSVRLQIGRIISDFNSEKEVRVANSKRLDEAIKRLDQLEIYKNFDREKLEKHDRILFNEGKGLIFKVDRIDRLIDLKKDNNRYLISLLLTVIAVLISIAALISKS